MSEDTLFYLALYAASVGAVSLVLSVVAILEEMGEAEIRRRKKGEE